jgi:hypothetical protein
MEGIVGIQQAIKSGWRKGAKFDMSGITKTLASDPYWIGDRMVAMVDGITQPQTIWKDKWTYNLTT